MHPTFIVAKREFLQRIRKRSFWLFLLLGPLFFLLILVVPIGLSMEKEGKGQVAVVDKSGDLAPFLYPEKDLVFVPLDGTTLEATQTAKKLNCDGLVIVERKPQRWLCRYYRLGMLGGKDGHEIEPLLQKRIQEYEMNSQGIEVPSVLFTTETVANKGETDMAIGFVAGLFMAMLILVFVNQYAQMVLRGVVEEKQNRISELILTSIKPTHFILGKVTGIASVAFLQMAIWFGSTSLISWSVYQHFQLDRFSNAHLATTLGQTTDVAQTMEINSLLNALGTLNIAGMLLGFLFYFVFGYLLFSALYAMVGIAVGSDSDAHQMAMPIALPLAIPLIALQSIVDNPHSEFAKFLSFFPLTSPTTMMIRLPFGVPVWEVLVSGALLFISFLLFSFMAAKVYRIGVLLYGKKLTWAEMWKWTLSH